MTGLRCEGLAKSYGDRPVLADVELDVPQGTLTAILGASGSGKTTLLRVVMGFAAADRGTISVGGRVVADAPRVHLAPEKRAIGYVAQEGALFPHLAVAENIGFGLARSLRRDGRRIDEALELVGLPHDYARRRPGELSGGEQRRVALARALAPRPAVVLLDEPFSGLDAALRAETRAAVLGAMNGSGATAVLVTHDQAEALSMGREVAVLRDGRLVQTAAPAALYHQPIDLGVARFVGEAIVVAGDAGDGSVACSLGTLPVRGTMHGGKVTVMIRPEQVRLTPDGVPATVVERSFFGADTVLRLQLEDGTPVSARLLGEEAPEPGDGVRLAVAGPVPVFPA